MNIYLNGSVLLQIGVSALMIVFLYGLHRFTEGFEEEDRQQLTRHRNARRWSDQEWVATLKSLSDRRFTSPFTVSTNWEDTTQSLDVMWGSSSSDLTQEVNSGMLDWSQYSIGGEPAL